MGSPCCRITLLTVSFPPSHTEGSANISRPCIIQAEDVWPDDVSWRLTGPLSSCRARTENVSRPLFHGKKQVQVQAWSCCKINSGKLTSQDRG